MLWTIHLQASVADGLPMNEIFILLKKFFFFLLRKIVCRNSHRKFYLLGFSERDIFVFSCCWILQILDCWWALLEFVNFLGWGTENLEFLYIPIQDASDIL